MSLILLVILNASIFSIDGIGEDLSIFRTPFTRVYRRANIEFTLNPEFNILNEQRNFRGIFWTNPFYFSFSIPITKGFIFAFGNLERLSQSFDIYFEENELEIHAVGEGGVEEIYANLNNNFGIGEIALRGSYLFGNSWEIWDYSVGDYHLIDSMLYKYHGKIFGGGLKFNLFSLSYECFGDIVVEKANVDTTINLPERLSIYLTPDLFGGKINLLFEHSFWGGDNGSYTSPNRFKIGFTKKNMSINYFFNPWYLSDVTEHGVIVSLATPIKNLGSLTINLNTSFRSKGSVREFKIIPQFQLTLEEIFSRRRK